MLSSYLRSAYLKKVLRETDFSAPAAVHASLHTANPGLTGANEVSGGFYARQQVSSWNVASGGVKTNSAIITFIGMPSCTVTYVGLWDSAGPGGNFLCGQALDASQVVEAGASVAFATTTFQVSFGDTKGFSDYLEQALVKDLLGEAAFTQPAGNFASLHELDPGDTGASELAVTRQNLAGIWGNEAGGQKINSSPVSFASMPASTVNYVSIWDAVSGGNCLLVQTVPALGRVVGAGTTFTVPAGQLNAAFA